MNKLKTILSFLLVAAFLLTGLPGEVITVSAASELAISIEYNPLTYKYDISFPIDAEPARTVVRFHDKDKNEIVIDDEQVFDRGRVTVSTVFERDHIYDITVEVYRGATDSTPYYTGEAFFLADLTFTGESFNQMAKMQDIEDAYPVLEPDSPGEAIVVKSGDEPIIKLNWRIPTIYDSENDEIISFTDARALEIIQLENVPIAKACFQINMTVGQSSTRQIDFNTDFDAANNMIIEGELDEEGNALQVAGFESGNVTDSDNMVSVLLKQINGIEAGTEYAYTNIGIVFENDKSEQITLRRTKLITAENNRFTVQNIDNAFRDTTYNLSSIYTPIPIEIRKVDTDKVEVRFRKIINGNYPELHYQVQYSSRIDEFYNINNRWVKIPASSLPATDIYGSEIVTVNIVGNTHPEFYFRVVYYDSYSQYPRGSSLAVDLRNLGIELGKPPLPKEIKADPLYAGRKEVTVPSTELSSGKVEIASSDLKLSFEKPISWRRYTNTDGNEGWDRFKNTVPTGADYIFHVLLSSYLPDSEADDVATTAIGLKEQKEIYLPTKQKRVLVLSKADFMEDPEDPNRIYSIIDGTELFYDYVNDSSIANENNEDPSEDLIPGDYPSFLIPNTTYFMQIFTSRLEDNDLIYDDLWADGINDLELNNRLSYQSPVLSFTTWPLTEAPVPMPDIELSIEPQTHINPETGDISLDGIRVDYERILTERDWQRYTTVRDNRAVRYELFISRDPLIFDTDGNIIDEAFYPQDAEIIQRGETFYADNKGNPILPNTVYYIKARATLVIINGSPDDPNNPDPDDPADIILGRSVDTAVKAITTPKIDDGNLEDVEREPRAPSEFSIAVDEEGRLLLTDATVILNWLHAEEDVTYEMVVTSREIAPYAEAEEYEEDPYNLGFLQAYDEYRNPAGDNKLHINVYDQAFEAIDLTLSENGQVIMPVRRDYLRPNRIYFFSLRAIRDRNLTDDEGNSIQTVSRWITIPVTTRMVKPPAFLEAVKDIEIGFNIENPSLETREDNIEVFIKKAEGANNSYVRLVRGEYSCVKDGTTFYIRIYNLESNQWYDVQVKDNKNNKWYDASSKTWRDAQGSPVKEETRDALREIEVRWEGEDPYKYFLEVRAEEDPDYQQLHYNSTGHTDYGYETPSGRIEFYREKTKLYVDTESTKYIYYARIKGKPVLDANRNPVNQLLKPNTLYYIKLWSYNLEESLRVGPVTARTDFSQADYDEQKNKDNTIDLFDESAEGLSRKLYWPINITDDTNLRVLLKDDRLEGLLKLAGQSTVTVDISAEKSNADYYEILIPYNTLSAIEKYDSRLNIKVSGGEFTLNKGSIDLYELKNQTLSGDVKESMLLLKITKRQNPKNTLDAGLRVVSSAYDLQTTAIGSTRTYAEINQMIHDILKNPDARGPFSYGILNRELTSILSNLERYSYRSHVDLKDLISRALDKVEKELSRNLKDIIDGGSGLTSCIALEKTINDFPDSMGIRLEYRYYNGFITPMANYGSGFEEPSGGKGYVNQYVLFRVKKPGEFLIVGKGQAIDTPGMPVDNAIARLSKKYDLSKVFGQGTIYPANPIKGEEAVMLYALVTGQENRITGLTITQKASALGLDIMERSILTGYMDNQSSVSIAVMLYCDRANINPSFMYPSKTIIIQNGRDINARLYPYVVLGVDLDIIKLNNKVFDASKRTTIGDMLDMVSKVLEKFD